MPTVRKSPLYRLSLSILVFLFILLIIINVFGEERFYSEASGIIASLVQSPIEETPIVETNQEVIDLDPWLGIDGFADLRGEYIHRLPTSRQSYVTSKKISLGAYFSELSPENFWQVIEHEDRIGHKLRYLLLFRSWGGDDSAFPVEYVPYLASMQEVPIITWEPWVRDFDNPTAIQSDYSLSSIASGEHDDYIRQWASSAKDADINIILRFAHEQSTPEGYRYWYPWQGNSRDYIRAYRRIVDIFRDTGADRVRFMWNPVAFWSAYTPDDYYPGSGYVDFIGLTVLNHGVKSNEEEEWKSCSKVYTKQLERLGEYKKPFMVVEFGSSENGGDKGQWLYDCLKIIDSNPQMIGLITLEYGLKNTHEGVDWRSNSSQSALKGLINGLNSGNYR